MTSNLCFNEIEFDVVDQNGTPWLRGLQIASALGFKNPSSDIKNIFDRNADEFTPDMTALVELGTAGGKQQVRIFSPRGCWLIGMFARTAKASIMYPIAGQCGDVLEKITQSLLEVRTRTLAAVETARRLPRPVTDEEREAKRRAANVRWEKERVAKESGVRRRKRLPARSGAAT
jgi:hypothetical protein